MTLSSHEAYHFKNKVLNVAKNSHSSKQADALEFYTKDPRTFIYFLN